ncbi:hypothetical protein QMZ30_06565 [Pantoea sp. EA-12]|uniref:hypothetical protein n=1 Tax=Pantoea sp. EA-12 TaxID=3043303 RepID=UPI0024B5C1F1|nr:hypothetical protein [Pantoea sp. EA-12]MDI9220561.1 hypothetical protein [Pantoea sp. EA-12]
MRANPTTFVSIKLTLLWLFIISFFLALTSIVGGWWYTSSQQIQCGFPMAFYDIKSEREVVVTKGVYRSYRDGFNQGHTSYLGTLSRFVDGELIAPVTNIHRALWFETQFHHNLLKIKVTHLSRGLGDRSHDDDVEDYVFPYIQPGDVSMIGLYMLDGKVLASGTENVARNICIR